MIGTNIVGIVKKDTFSYPDKEELFRRGERYPEYIFEEYSTLRNEIYDAERVYKDNGTRQRTNR